MRAAYDEVMTLAAKRQHGPERVVADLLTAQLADVQSRATAYRMGQARLPAVKALGEFDFAASPVNAALVTARPRRRASAAWGVRRRSNRNTNSSRWAWRCSSRSPW